MLRKNLLNFKLNFSEISSDQLFADFMKDYDPGSERCTSCGAVGMCRRFAYYERGLVDVVDGKVTFRRLRILRVKCSCGHTHAVLPDLIIPYGQYSLPFVLHILRLHFSRMMTAEAIYEAYGVPHSTLYRWKKAFLKHMSWWLGALTFAVTSAYVFLNALLEEDSFSDFLLRFFRKTLISFLQTHANPANCCRLFPALHSERGHAT